MLSNKNFMRLVLGFFVPILASGFWVVCAQDETLADIKYKDDYERIQRIIKVSDPIRRVDQMMAFYRERSDVDPKLLVYADNIVARDLESMMKQGNFIALRGICERVLKVRPRLGEAYLFYGVALKQEKKIPEAMNAFAKCSLITTPVRSRCKQQLDVTYRSVSGGSLIGEDKIIKNALKELK